MSKNNTTQSKNQQVNSEYRQRKMQSLRLAESFVRLGMLPQSMAVRNCGTWLQFIGDKLGAANFCKNRLCPICQYRRSRRAFWVMSQMLDWMDAQDERYRFVFLTLTVRNCAGADLRDVLTDMSAAFNRMRNHRRIKSAIRGFARSTEVTIGKNGSYHPHYHLILAVTDDYYEGMITQDEYCRIWQKSCKLDYKPVCYVRAISAKRTNAVDAMAKPTTVLEYRAVCEVSKYAAKSSQYLSRVPEITDSRVNVLYHALRGKRLISYCGIFADAARALKINMDEDADIGRDGELRPDVDFVVTTWYWSSGVSRYQLYIPDADEVVFDVNGNLTEGL